VCFISSNPSPFLIKNSLCVEVFQQKFVFGMYGVSLFISGISFISLFALGVEARPLATKSGRV
jgi:hypothetical protein